MGYQDLMPITTTGATEPRYLGDRFADIINVKDFGAKGDGSDATAAFNSAISTANGKPIFIPSGNYVINSHGGKFVSIDDVYISKESSMANLSFLANIKPKDCGGDFADQPTQTNPTDIRAWPAVHQGAFVDPYDDVFYASNTNGVKQTRLVISKWSSVESERRFIAVTPYAYDWVAHQSLSFYRPSKAHALLVCCTKSPYVNSSTEAKSLTEIFNMWKFDYTNPSTHTLYKSFRIVPAAERESNSTVQAVVSFDGKYLVAFYTSTNSQVRIVVWKMSDIMSLTSGSDITNNYTYKYTYTGQNGAEGNSGGQGIACDGANIYILSGTDSTKIDCISVDGTNRIEHELDRKLDKPLNFFTSYNGTTPTSLESETEGLFFAKYANRMCAFVCIVHKAYNLGNDSSFSRYHRFYCLSIPESTAISDAACEPSRLRDTGITDANNLYDACLTMPYGSECANLPVPSTGYMQVLNYPTKNQNARQIYWGVGTNVDNIFTRLVTSNHTAATDWRKFAMANVSGTVDVLSSERMENHNTTSWSCILKFRNQFEASHPNTYGYLGRYRKNENPGSDSDGIRSITVIGSVEGSHAGDGDFAFYIDQHNATVKKAFFVFTKASTADLGFEDKPWDNLYCNHGPWGGSDLRLKDSIEDPSKALIKAWSKVDFKIFRMKDAIAKKGEDARLHIGVIAQEVESAFESEGLDACRYGLFGHASWEDEYEDIEVVDTEAVVDNDGNEISPAITHNERRLVREAGDKYMIRYEEALVLECAYLRSCVNELRNEIDQLKSDIAQLKSQQSN